MEISLIFLRGGLKIDLNRLYLVEKKELSLLQHLFCRPWRLSPDSGFFLSKTRFTN